MPTNTSFLSSINEPRLEQQLLRTLAANIPHSVYAKDIDCRFIFANSGVAESMGANSSDDLLGKSDFDFYPKENAEEYFSIEKKIMETGSPIFNQEEHVKYASSNRERWFLTTKVPLYGEDGRIIGLVGVNYDITAQKEAEQALRAANNTAEMVAFELKETVDKLSQEMQQRQQFEKQLRKQALYDSLTGLANRTLLMERLEQAIALANEDSHSLGVIFIDIDRLKIVNDSLGHNFGDQLLKIISERIRSCVKQSDTCARLGGDEFVIVLPNTSQNDDFVRLTDRLFNAIAEPLKISDQELSISCSMGCSFYPRDGSDAVSLLKNADVAMYQAKDHGGNRVKYFVQAFNQGVDKRLELETQLRQAITRGEFVLHYQPQLDLNTGLIVGVEALIRWQHPEKGLVPPLEFIAVAENIGLIETIGEWVLRTACQQAVIWNQMNMPPLRMSVNLSANQFLSPGLDHLVGNILKETSLAPELLELELTESASMRNPLETIRILSLFRELGIRIAIDDFGTGYSNLSYLRRFPVHHLKLDRSFVSELTGEDNSQAIVEAIVHMSNQLNIDLIAEGVETVEQCQQLKNYECKLIQGYWFSRPLDAATCESLLLNHKSLT